MNASDDEYAKQTAQEALEAEFYYLYGKDAKSRTDCPQSLPEAIHSLNDDTAPWALSLSGGGIRSATFGLGVLQGLASRGMLSRFNYLSTVSGGGYIGSWLSRWIAAYGGDVDKVQKEIAGGTSGSSATEAKQVSQLRAYSNYLSPTWGISSDFFALVSIVLRNLILNWFVLIPVLAAALLLPYLYIALLNAEFGESCAGAAMIALGSACLGFGVRYVVADLPGEKLGPRRASNRFVTFCFAPVFVAAILFSVGVPWLKLAPGSEWNGWDPGWWFCIGGAAIHLLACVAGRMSRRTCDDSTGLPLKSTGSLKKIGSFVLTLAFVLAGGGAGGGLLYLLTRWLPGAYPGNDSCTFYATVTVPGLLMSFWMATTLYVALTREKSTEDQREWWARSGGWWLSGSICWLLGFSLVLYVPIWILEFPFANSNGTALLAGGGLWGVITGLLGYWSKNDATISSHARGFASVIGARLLDLAAVVFILALLLAICFALDWWGSSLHGNQPTPDPTVPKPVAALTLETATRAAEAVAVAAKALNREDVQAKSIVARPIAPELSAALVSNAKTTGFAASELLKSTTKASGDEAEMLRLADAVILGAKAVTVIAEQIPESNAEASAEISSALGSVSEAAAGLGARVLPAANEIVYGVRLKQEGSSAFGLFVMLVLLGWGASKFVGVNTFSIHSMYGNRLVRAYFGAARARESRHPHCFTGFDNNDNISMSELCKAKVAGRPRLFHVVNLALNIVAPSGGRLEWQQRKAASFSVTPLHTGSAAVGYVQSKDYAAPDGLGISLARAMTISGAAASPNMGYSSSMPVALVMTLFNVRLGWWLPNTAAIGKDIWQSSDPKTLSLRLLLNEALGLTTADQPYVYLSDGGHFENLALYEMVRRRCRKILVVDASADSELSYDDLQEAIRKIRIDLGISIEFESGCFESQRRYSVGKIRYRDTDGNGKDGILCYLKPGVFGDEPLDVLRYAAVSRKNDGTETFPHQTTADQFFDESQFESYRMLGYHMLTKIFANSCDWPTRSAPTEKMKFSLPSSRHVGEKPGSAGDSGGVISKIADSAQNFSQGALLASAITVGGVLGVSGSVALKDPAIAVKPGAEINISKESLEALIAAMKIEAGTPAEIPQRNIDLLTKTLEGITTDLKNIDDKQQITAELAAKLEGLIIGLDARVRDIEASIRAGGPLPKDSIQRLSVTVSGLAVAVSNLTNENGVLKQLSEIEENLAAIKKSVQEAPPRRNVRGVEGAGR